MTYCTRSAKRTFVDGIVGTMLLLVIMLDIASAQSASSIRDELRGALKQGRWSLRTERLAFRFDVDRTPPLSTPGLIVSNDRTATLTGGFVQPAVYLRGNRTQGMQLLLGGEFANLDVRGNTDGDTL